MPVSENRSDNADTELEMKRERTRESNRAYRDANPEYMRAWRDANREKKREYDRKYRAANHEKVRESVRNWQVANPEKRREADRKYLAVNYDKHREAVRRYQAKYPEKHLEMMRAANQRRRASVKTNTDNAPTAAQLKSIRELPCCYCGQPGPSAVDHYIPLARGGTHTLDNLRPACRSCNSRKGAKLPSEWIK